MGIHWKIQFLGGGAVAKNQYIGEIAEKRGGLDVFRFEGGLGKKRGCFWGGVDTPMHTMIATKPLPQSHCKMMLFFLIFNTSQFVSCKNSNNLVSI